MSLEENLEELVEEFKESEEHMAGQGFLEAADAWGMAAEELEAVLNGDSPESVHELPEDIPSGDVGEILNEQEK